jgi:hypothetical protein
VSESQRERQERLTAQFGKPERIAPSDALAAAFTAGVPVDQRVTAGDVFAAIYRDAAAAAGWAAANLEHHGHPPLATVPLPDGRAIGIIDLRPAIERARTEAGEA